MEMGKKVKLEVGSANGVVDGFTDELLQDAFRLVVYTDGSHSPKTQVGSWAWVVPGVESNSCWDEVDGNVEMELRAVLEAIYSLDGQPVIFTDYADIALCFTKNWWERWEENEWVKENGDPIKNQELWKLIIQAHKQRELC